MKRYTLILIAILLSLTGFSQWNWVEGDSIMISGGGTFGNIVDHDTNRVTGVDTAINDYDAMPKFQIIDNINALALTNPIDSIVLNPDLPQSGSDLFSAYTIKADSLTGLIIYSGEDSTISYFNATTTIPFINNTGSTILKGTPLSSNSIDFKDGRGLPTASITNSTSLLLSQTFVGVARDSVQDGKVGLALKLNFLTGYNTSGFGVDDIIYVSADSLTNIEPTAPDYKIIVGKVITSDAVNGIIAITATPFTGSDTDINLQGFLNGIITQKQAIRDTVIGGVVYFETYNEEDPTIDLPFMSSKVRYNLNTTTSTGFNGYARVALTVGTETESQSNYIYIDNTGTPTLMVSTTAFPDAGIRVAECGVSDLTTHQARGFTYFQRFNNSVNGTVADGWVSKTSKRLRLEGSKYEAPGIDPTVTITTDGTVLDSLAVTTNVGIIWQYNRQSFSAQTGGKYLWLNSPTGERFINDLNEVDSTEAGIDLHGGNNRRYGLNIFAIQNSGDFADHLAVTAPTDYYSTDQNAIDDVNGYAVTNVPQKYSKTGARLFRVVINYSTASNGTLTNLLGAGEFQDERGFPLGTSGTGTGTGGAQVNFSDADFTIFNNSDPTKIIQFDASNITTGTTRTYTAPDISDTLAVLSDIKELETSSFEFEITVGGENDITTPFTIKNGSSVYYNGTLLNDAEWSGEGTTTLTLITTTLKYDNITLKNN